MYLLSHLSRIFKLLLREKATEALIEMKMTNSSPDVMFEAKVHAPIRPSIKKQRQPGLRSGAKQTAVPPHVSPGFHFT